MSAGRASTADSEAARHLKRGRRMPDTALASTNGEMINLSRLEGRSIVYCYPWTGRPGEPNPPGWDDIAGAHGSTPQTEGFRNLYGAFRNLKTRVFGLSTQPTEYQREMVERLGVPFGVLSDAEFRLQRALSLPVFETGGIVYLERLTLAIMDGRIERVFYPVPVPAANAREVCAWLAMTSASP